MWPLFRSYLEGIRLERDIYERHEERALDSGDF